MKLSTITVFAVLASSIGSAVVREATSDHLIDEEYKENDHLDKEAKRNLIAGTTCRGSTLSAGERLYAGESICGEIDGEMVYYGVRSYASNPQPGYTLTRLEIWSEFGTYDRWFRGIGSTLTSFYLQLQNDGNLVFDGNTVGCVAKPAARGPNVEVTIGDTPLPDIVVVRDNNGDVLWKLGQHFLSNGATYLSGSGCYPETAPQCVSVLKDRQRLSWNDYLCEYDETGSVVTRFGLDKYGLLGVWNATDYLQWRPRPSYHVRGDYLHLQEDGHLTLYRQHGNRFEYTWTSGCFPPLQVSTKLLVGDGEVRQFRQDGTVSWAVLKNGKPYDGNQGNFLDSTCLPQCDQ
jgi:hypothetical protein